MSYCNIQVPKSENFENWGSLIEHSSHWINFIIFTFINEKEKENYRLIY